jgi:hypothetical protein
MMNDLLHRVLEAHGGLERWHKVESLDVPVTIIGALFQRHRVRSRERTAGRTRALCRRPLAIRYRS